MLHPISITDTNIACRALYAGLLRHILSSLHILTPASKCADDKMWREALAHFCRRRQNVSQHTPYLLFCRRQIMHGNQNLVAQFVVSAHFDVSAQIQSFGTAPLVLVAPFKNLDRSKLKEKLPQAFLQIGWMEDDFRNLTAKVWANLDNPITRYDFWKVSLISRMSLSQVALF